MGKTGSCGITTSIILNTLVLAGALWLVIKSAQLRDHDKLVNLFLPKVLDLWAYDAFAAFGSVAMILVGFGYATLCFCRDTCFSYFQLTVLILYTCVSVFLLWPLLVDYERLDRVSRGESDAVAETIGKSFKNLFNNAQSG
ncbi:uncharacterized protein LOC134838395 [Culicoides brevitarsis]|uniref:uncharacterized protein LOC134838395 n=1 Tax=Culicoides brevitarsis TaxID=469753 RepID=UPI00307B61FB